MERSGTIRRLCMARAVAREGYPEIALYREKTAFEEIGYAAKGRFDLAVCANSGKNEGKNI